MPSRRKNRFCQQLADWLYSTEWHFTTLLAICIDSIRNLPDDVDNFINCLLLSYPDKPSRERLCDYLNNSTIIEDWFHGQLDRPYIASFNLLDSESTSKPESDLHQFESLFDLTHWLDISPTQLEWLADLRRVDECKAEKYKHYHYRLIKKKRGGMRLLESPKTLLKRVQRQIYSELLTGISVHHSAHGFMKNRNCVSHAQNHTNQEYLFTFDLADYFHSIDWYAVYKVFRRQGYSDEIAKYLSGLCTHRFNGPKTMLQKLNTTQGKRVRKRHLAQGAPTSPALSNLVMHNLDKRLHGLAKKLKLNYSRYADDMVFSGNHHRDWRFLEPLVGSICLEEGFELNYKKSRLLRSHQRQKVTGVVVNQGVNIDRCYYDQLKAILTNCIRHGAKSQNIEKRDNLQAYLLGRINFVNSLNPNKGQKLFDLYHQINFD